MDNKEYIEFMELVQSMRRCQMAYFDARKRHDATMATKYLEESKRRESEVDKHIAERMDRLKYGEQKNLFK